MLYLKSCYLLMYKLRTWVCWQGYCLESWWRDRHQTRACVAPPCSGSAAHHHASVSFLGKEQQTSYTSLSGGCGQYRSTSIHYLWWNFIIMQASKNLLKSGKQHAKHVGIVFFNPFCQWQLNCTTGQDWQDSLSSLHVHHTSCKPCNEEHDTNNWPQGYKIWIALEWSTNSKLANEKCLILSACSTPASSKFHVYGTCKFLWKSISTITHLTLHHPNTEYIPPSLALGRWK